MSESNYTSHSHYPNVLISKEEEWRDVVGYEGFCMVSNKGRVKYLERLRHYGHGIYKTLPEKMLKPWPCNKAGHLWVTIRRNSKAIYPLVHRLVLESFVGSCPDGMEGCHYDGIPSNNCLENLRWDTHSNNMKDRERNGTFWCPKLRGEKNGNSKLTDDQVIKIRDLYFNGSESMSSLAKTFGVSVASIWNIVNFKTRKYTSDFSIERKTTSIQSYPKPKTEVHIDKSPEIDLSIVTYTKHPNYEDVLVPSIEIWVDLDIKGREGRFQISTYGRVKALAWYRKTGRGLQFVPEKMLKCLPNRYGYCCAVGRFVHELVLKTFVGPRPENKFGLHGDGNRSNNKLENLRWGTHKENWEDKRKHGTAPVGEKHGAANLTKEQALDIYALSLTGEFSIQDLVEMFKSSRTIILRIVNGKHWAFCMNPKQPN